MSNNFRCPKCGSDNIQSYEVIYNSGRASHVSTTDGISVGSDFSVGHANTSGSSITHLAETCAPPTKAQTAYMGVVGFIAMGVMFTMVGDGMGWAALLVCMPAAWYYWRLSRRNSKWNSEIFPRMYDNWKHSYLCNKCGNRFIIDDKNNS